jgi:hypothetical protein
MTELKNSCNGTKSKLADLLLDPSSVPAGVHAHVAECEGCRSELDALKATMSVMDAWKAPEPSPYFFTRLNARMREEREAAPAGWLARLRASLVYGQRSHMRPLAAMALTVMLLLGGGTYLGVNNWTQPAQPLNNEAAVVHDLQTLDNNAQLLDTLEDLSQNNGGE